MTTETVPTHDHILTLKPGTRAGISFRFAPGGITVELAAADPASRSLELLLDNLWGPYEMMQVGERGGKETWMPIRPAQDGKVHAVVNPTAGESVYLFSDGPQIHTLSLEAVTWQGNEVVLTFRETA